MATERYIAPGHRLSDEDWAAVVRRAAEVRQELVDNAGGGASGPGGIVVDMTARGIASRKYFPVSGIPTQLLVLHSAECPLRVGFAISLSEWFSATIYPAPPIASWQRFIDPVHRVRALPDELGAWHASEANPLSIGWEQSGYARFTREEWLTPDGLAQLELLAFDMAEVAVRDGIPAVWLTTEQVTAITSGRDRTTKGFCFHRQIDPETRTDPGDGYPDDLLMERIKAYMSGTPLDTGDIFMALSDAEQRRVLAAADRINGRDQQRWIGPNGEVSDTWQEGWFPARSVDLHDVLALHQLAHDNTTKILDAVRNIPGVDTTIIDQLGEELSAELKKSLRVTLVPEAD